MAASKPSSDPFVQAYFAGELASFYALEPGAAGAALELPRTLDRDKLSSALQAYAEKLAAPDQVFKSLEQLSHPDSRVVVTGQQAGLLLGPSYTLAKAMTAIRLARQLSREAKPVLPVFWVASQDHDTEEIDHAYVLDKGEHLHRLAVPLPEGVPAGRIALETAWLESIVADLEALGDEPGYLAEVTDLLRRGAERATTFADWFAALLYALLGEQGLIVLNPLEPDIAPLFKEVFVRELEAPAISTGAINDAAKGLSAHGLSPQLGRGEGATNLFLEEGQGDDLRRSLLRFDGNGFATEEASYTRDELLRHLDTEPSAITPAAGLRPISQDAILPTAVTVVGPGELRYFAQLRKVYEHHGVAMPLIWPRATATVLEPPVARILEKFGLNALSLMQSFEETKAATLLELHGHADAFEAALATLEKSAERLSEEVAGIDPTLQGTVLRAEHYIETSIEKMRGKAALALERQEDIYARQFARLEAHLLPTGQPQDRVISPFSFFLKFGIAPVLRAFLELPPEGDHTLQIA